MSDKSLDLVIQVLLAWIIVYCIRLIVYPTRWTSSLPGPPLNAIFGAGLTFASRYGDVHRIMLEWSLVFGDVFDFHVVRKGLVYLNNPAHVASVLANKNNTPGVYGAVCPEVFGETSHLVRSGPKYTDAVSKAHAALSASQELRYHARRVTATATAVVNERVDTAQKSGAEVDADGMFVDAAVAAMAVLALGRPLESGGGEEVGRKIPVMLENACELWGGRRYSVLSRLFKNQALETMTATVRGFVLDRVKDAAGGKGKKGATVTSLLREAGLDDEAIRDEVVTYLAGGGCALGHTMSWALFCLCSHPEERAEVMEGLREGKTARMRAFLLETVRMYPANGVGSTRILAEDLTVTNSIGREYYLSAGAQVWLGTFSSQRHPDYWPKPWEFDVTRFAKGVPDSYLAFVNDSLYCLDMETSLDFMCAVLGAFMEAHPTVRLVGENPTEAPVHTFVLRPGAGLRVAL